MKVWGQWVDQEGTYSFIVRNGRFKFNHWENPENNREDWESDPIHKKPEVKFYIQLIF